MGIARAVLPALLVLSLFTVPIAAQLTKVATIGVLLLIDHEVAKTAFRDGLRDLRYVEGQNVRLEYRAAEGQIDRLPELAAELARLKVDVIVTQGTLATRAAKRATNEIPIVMTSVGDPIGTGLIASLARPGGNVTGISSATADLGGKLLELLREIQPAVTRVAVLTHATDPFARPFLTEIQSAAGTVGVRVQPVVVRGAEDFDGAFATMVKDRAGAVVIQPILATKRAAELAMKYRLPSITTGFGVRTFPEVGGLMSYGTDPVEFYRRAAVYVDKILKGAKPADLPVEQPTKFLLVINAKVATALRLVVPSSLLVRADRVIQ